MRKAKEQLRKEYMNYLNQCSKLFRDNFRKIVEFAKSDDAVSLRI